MKLANRLRGFFTPRPRHLVQARYQGADWSILRSVLLSSVVSAKVDISASTRTELLRKSRHFYQNSPLARALTERLVIFTIGSSGIQPSPKSSSDRWNARARKYWDRWARRCEVTGQLGLPAYQRMFTRASFVDGDAFTLFTEDGLLQLVEGHRIGSPQNEPGDGVITNQEGRPLAYQLLDDKRNLERELPAQSVVHHVFRERAGQPRGVGILACAINTLNDVTDILDLEKQGVKSASSITDIIKTLTGEYNYEDAVRSGAASGDDAERKAYYESVFGAAPKVLRVGDDFAQYRSDRPSEAWHGFMEFLTSGLALATGFPPSVLLNSKMGGADSRRDLATAQRVVECWQAEIATQMDRVWEFVIEGAKGLGSAPADWRDVEWQYPVRLTVDAGREAQADREDLRSGVISLEEFCARYGIDWRTHLAQLKEEQGAVKDADDTGLLTQRLYGNPNSAPPVKPPPEEQEPEPEPEPDEEEEVVPA